MQRRAADHPFDGLEELMKRRSQAHQKNARQEANHQRENKLSGKPGGEFEDLGGPVLLQNPVYCLEARFEKGGIIVRRAPAPGAARETHALRSQMREDLLSPFDICKLAASEGRQKGGHRNTAKIVALHKPQCFTDLVATDDALQ